MKKLFTAFFLIFATAVWAGDFEDGVAASDKGGYKTAFSFYKKLAAQGGPYAMPLLVTICNIDSPSHLYQILGVISVEDFDNVFGRQRIRTALSEQIKAAWGDNAVVGRHFGRRLWNGDASRKQRSNNSRPNLWQENGTLVNREIP